MAADLGVEISLETRLAIAELAKLDRALSKTATTGKKEIGNLDSSVGKLEKSFGSLITLSPTQIFVAAGAAAIKAAIDFAALETAIIGVAKTTGISGKELDSLVNNFQRLSQEIPVSTNELLTIAQAAGQLGITGSSNIESFTAVIAKLGFATDLSGEQAAQSLARLVKLTTNSVGEVENIASALVFLGNTTEASESQILNLTSELARATSQFGISSQDALGLGAVLASLGQRAQGSASVVGRAFQTIATSIGEGGKKFERLQTITGLTGDQLKKTFKEDSEQVFRLFLSGINNIDKKGIRTITKSLAEFGLIGDEVLRVLPLLAQKSDELNGKVSASGNAFAENTALTKEADAAFQSLGASWDKLKNTVTNLSSTIGSVFAPALKSSFDGIREFLTFLGDAPSALSGTQSETKKLSDEIARLRIKLKDLDLQRQVGFDVTKEESATNARISLLKKEIEEVKTLEQLNSKPPRKLLPGDFTPTNTQPDIGPPVKDRTEAEINAEKTKQIEIAAIRQQADLAEEERLLNLKVLKEEDTATDLERLREIELEKQGIIFESELQKSQLITDETNRKLEQEKISNANRLKLISTQSKQELDAERSKADAKKKIKDQELKDQEAFFAAAVTLANSENSVLAGIGKAAAITQIAIKTPPAIASSYEFGTKIAGPPGGAIFAGIAAAAMAAQAAKIAGVKGFQGGGIVPGPRSDFDNTTINAAGGELILNRRQQQNLFDTIDAGKISGSGGGITVNIDGGFIGNDQGIDSLIDAINDRVEFGNAALSA